MARAKPKKNSFSIGHPSPKKLPSKVILDLLEILGLDQKENTNKCEKVLEETTKILGEHIWWSRLKRELPETQNILAELRPLVKTTMALHNQWGHLSLPAQKQLKEAFIHASGTKPFRITGNEFKRNLDFESLYYCALSDLSTLQQYLLLSIENLSKPQPRKSKPKDLLRVTVKGLAKLFSKFFTPKTQEENKRLLLKVFITTALNGAKIPHPQKLDLYLP